MIPISASASWGHLDESILVWLGRALKRKALTWCVLEVRRRFREEQSRPELTGSKRNICFRAINIVHTRPVQRAFLQLPSLFIFRSLHRRNSFWSAHHEDSMTTTTITLSPDHHADPSPSPKQALTQSLPALSTLQTWVHRSQAIAKCFVSDVYGLRALVPAELTLSSYASRGMSTILLAVLIGYAR